MHIKQSKPCWQARIGAVALTLAVSGSIALGQTRTVTGTVVDEFGEPVIGANILIKGTTTGAITDIDGNFSLSGVSDKSVLVVSYIGYASQELPTKGQNSFSISLREDNDILEEVVVVGYGTTKKRDLIGAISSVKSEDIKAAPVMNAMEGLQGAIAGLDITRESGAAGSTPQVLLRGNRSLDGSNDPLYVIDGVSGGSINDVNPNDIESIEVLKDASSTAIYGSAGANGVIIVTTKQGKAGKVQVDFNAYVGINCMPAYPDTYVGEEWVDYLQTGYEAYYGVSLASQYADRTQQLNRLFQEYGLSDEAVACYNNGEFINWKDEILQTGVQQNYNVSIRGGNEKTNSYLSIGYQNEKGMYRNDNYKQYTFRAGSTYNINKYVSAGFQSTLNYKDRDKRNSRLEKTLNAEPLGRVYDENGELNKYPTGNSSDYINIMADELPYAYENNSTSTGLNIAPFLEIKPLKGLSYKSMLNVSLSYSNGGQWEGLNTYYKLTGSSTNIGKRAASTSNSHGWGYQWQNVVTYNRKVAKVHDFTLTGIMEYKMSTHESGSASNEQFEFDEYYWYNMGAGKLPNVSSSWSRTKMLSYAGRFNYSLMGRYLLAATMRWDGSSVLYNQWDSFPSVSIGWRISDEAWMKQFDSWLYNLKLRAGYGITGNSNVGFLSSKTVVVNGSDLNLGAGKVKSYILSQHVANYDLTWEKSYNLNIGLDFGFLGGRIDGSLEYYNTDSKGVLYNRHIPSTNGMYNAKNDYLMTSNIAKTNNHGIELTLNTANIQKKHFKWNSVLTFTKNVESLKEIDLGNNTTVSELISLGLFMDNPINTYYGYKKVGIWQLGEEDMAACFGREPGQVHLDAPGLKWDPDYNYEGYTRDRQTNEYTAVQRHGAYYSEDADGNRTYYYQASPVRDDSGKITGTQGGNTYSVGANDKQILGHKNPNFTIGFTNKFQFYDFDLSIQTVMRWGQMVNGDLLGYCNAKNQPKSFDYWTPSNPTNAFPLAKLGVSNEDKAALTYVDGSFVKIKNITVGYTLPAKIAKKSFISNMRLYATVQNPFIFAKDDMLKGLDPENTSSSFPLYKTFVFGINCSF